MSTRIGDGGLFAEQSVLGAILLNPALLPYVRLAAADFGRAEHARIYDAMLALDADGRPIDAVTLADRLPGVGAAYLVELADNSPTAANIDAWADAVRRASQKRRALAIVGHTEDALRRGSRPVCDVMAELMASAEGMSSDTAAVSLSMSEVLNRAVEAADVAHTRRGQGGVVGAPSGLPTLDNRMGGLVGPRLVIPAARPGVGKTALMTQWAHHAASRGFRVGICSLEMSDTEIGMRTLAVSAGLNAAALARGSAEAYESLQRAVTENRLTPIRALPIFWDFDSFSLGAIVARITAWRRTERIDFAVVDHIGLIEAEGYKTRVEQLGAVSRTLKKLAKRLGIPIVAVSQLSRASEKDKRPPQLSDLRDSGNLEQDADVVLMLHASNEPDENGTVELDIGLLKCRDGIKGWLPCKFLFDGRAQRFRELMSGPDEPLMPSGRSRSRQWEKRIPPIR